MTCTNWFLTILAAVTFAVVVWPGYGASEATSWIVGICMLLIVFLAWSWVDCKPCRLEARKTTKRTPVKKKAKRKKK